MSEDSGVGFFKFLWGLIVVVVVVALCYGLSLVAASLFPFIVIGIVVIFLLVLISGLFRKK